MNNASIVDVLIENIKEDQLLLSQTDERIDEIKEEKRIVTDRLKGYRRDISVLLKYANQNQQEKIKKLGFDVSESTQELNAVASMVLEILIKSKEKQFTNAQLYEAYIKSLKNKEEVISYTAFNIKCRSLFNSQKLLRKKGKDLKYSRLDVIMLNERIYKKTEHHEKKDAKTA